MVLHAASAAVAEPGCCANVLRKSTSPNCGDMFTIEVVNEVEVSLLPETINKGIRE